MKALFVLVFTLILLAIPHPSFACTCIARPIEYHYKQADTVFVGRVIITPDQVGVVTFEVSQYWKGKTPVNRKLILVPLSRMGMFNTCEVFFKLGEEYLVFASKNKAGELVTTACSGTKPLYASADIKQLGPPKTPPK